MQILFGRIFVTSKLVSFSSRQYCLVISTQMQNNTIHPQKIRSVQQNCFFFVKSWRWKGHVKYFGMDASNRDNVLATK